MPGPISYLDYALIAVCFISGLLAMYRGFAREMLSIVSWAAALLAVLYFVMYHRPFAVEMAKEINTNDTFVLIAVGAVIFLIVLIVVHLITARISDSILDSRIGMVDRILGFLFGVARGFVIIVIPYMFYKSFFPDPQQHYPWVRDASSLPYIDSAGEWIKHTLEGIIPSSFTGEQPPEEAPPPSGQQGFLEKPRGDELALEVGGNYHISVTWLVRAG
jgi:membrane protein required for colicin V production